MRHRLVSQATSLLTAALLLAACDTSKPATPPEAPAQPAPTAQQPAEPAPAEQGGPKAPEAPKPAQPAIEDAQAQALLQSWLDAQNKGDLEAYTNLYAARFTGVRRVGERASTFDRDGWIKDRGRMFKKLMKVEATNTRITATAQSAVITFEQTWESGGYRDVGPKQLIIVREGDALKIAREELLSSQIEGARQMVGALSEAQFGNVLHKGSTMALILTPNVNPDEHEHDAPRSLARGHAAWAKLKKQDAALDLELFGPAGKVCDVKGQELGLFAHVTPHFGQIQSWDGTFEENTPRMSDDDVAASVVRLAAAEGVHRGVRVDANACAGAVWGRVKQTAAASVFPAVDTKPLEVRAQAELRKLAAWKAIQKDYEAEGLTDAPASWDEHEPSKSFAAWQAPDGKTVYVAHSVSAGSGCGQFEGEVWAVWRVLGGDAWTLVSDPKAPGTLMSMPSAAADLDGDGLPELIAPDTLIQPAGTIWRVTRDIAPPYYDCPC